MAYIGAQPNKQLTETTSQSFNGTGSATAFTLNRAVNTGEELEVFVDNVQQEPGVGKSYTATGTTLTFDEAPPSGTGNVYVIYRGQAEVTTRLEAPDLSITTAKLAADAVTTAKIADDAVTRAKMADDLSGTNLAIDTTSSTFKMTDLTSNAFYRIGTWTPILSSNNATDTSLSCINQTNATEQGHYVRIGDIVHCNFYLILPSVSFSFTNGASGTDSTFIRGLPFNIQNLTNYYPVASCGYFANWTGWTASYTPMGYLNVGNQALHLTHATTGGTSPIQLASVGFQSAAMIYSFTYKTDDA